MPPREPHENEEWRRELQRHKDDAYAHQAMLSRVVQENLSLRERFENRLKATEDRLSAFESFKGQVTLLGGIGFLVLGVVLAGLIQRIFGLHW